MGSGALDLIDLYSANVVVASGVDFADLIRGFCVIRCTVAHDEETRSREQDRRGRWNNHR